MCPCSYASLRPRAHMSVRCAAGPLPRGRTSRATQKTKACVTCRACHRAMEPARPHTGPRLRLGLRDAGQCPRALRLRRAGVARPTTPPLRLPRAPPATPSRLRRGHAGRAPAWVLRTGPLLGPPRKSKAKATADSNSKSKNGPPPARRRWSHGSKGRLRRRFAISSEALTLDSARQHNNSGDGGQKQRQKQPQKHHALTTKSPAKNHPKWI